MSDVEKLWAAVAVKFGDNRKWAELSTKQQNVFIQGCNCFLAVLHRVV